MKKKLSIILAAAMMTTVFTGCSNSGSGSGSDTIKIGMVAPITGNNAEYGKSMNISGNLAVKEINEAGGILGKQVELVVMDSKGDPKEATEIARKLSGDDDIVGVVGAFSSSECMAGANIYQDAGVIQLSPTASHPDYAKMGDFMFAIAGRQDTEAPFMADQLAKSFLDTKKIGVVYINNDWGVATVDNFKKTCEEIGVEVTATEEFFEGEKDFNAVLTKVRQTNPDTLCLMVQYTEAAVIAKQIKQMNWDVKVMVAGASYSDQLIELAGSDVEGIYSESPFILEETDKNSWDFAQKFIEEAGYTPTVHAPFTYDATKVLCDAIERSGSVDRKAVRDELAKTKDYQGIAGPITFTENGDINRKYRILTIEDGKWKALTSYDDY